MGTGTRAHPRAAIEIELRSKKGETVRAYHTANISKGGLFIKSDAPLDVGTRLNFELDVPGESTTLELEGRVVWTSQSGIATPHASPGMGVVLLWPDESVQITFSKLVEALIAKQQPAAKEPGPS